MNKKRPINLDLTTIKLPVMGLASILHRLSGVGLFLLLPFILYCFGQSVKDTQSFIDIGYFLAKPFYKFVVWLFCAALIYHLLAGVRHVLMDLGFGEGLASGRRSAQLVILLAVILTFAMGIWLW